MRLPRLAFLAAFSFAILCATLTFADDSDGQVKELKVLAIGNSFSGNASRYLPDIVKAGGSSLVFGHAMIGGCSMEKHMKLANLHESSPESPEGRPYKLKDGSPASLKELLLSDKWQLVTIQQFSGSSFKPETYRPFAKELCDYIRKYAPQAEIAVHETWAYRADNANTFKDGFTADKMYKGIANAYYGIAKELGIKRVIPSGDAFQLVYETQPFTPDTAFDPAKALKQEDLPKQGNSLHVGWTWDGKTGKAKYDHGHANMRGEYLAGLVWYEKLFKGDATKLSFKPNGLDEKDAAFLRSIAHEVVSEGKLPASSPFRTN